MAAELLGVHFKAVVGSMLDSTQELLFPDLVRQVREMQDDAWYPWDEYVRVVQRICARLPAPVVMVLAQESVLRALAGGRPSGLDSVEALLGDFSAVAARVVRELPAAHSVRTVSLATNSAILESGTTLPPAMLAGVFKGCLLGLGKSGVTVDYTQHLEAIRFVLRWR